MTSSTRVARLGTLEIHLKKSVEVTREVADQIPQLPTDDPWVILRYNPNSGKWQNAQTFESFQEADEKFVTLAQNNGAENASRLKAGGGPGAPREVTPE
jgi:hypothetical protein